jgi:hypothetical protein
MCEVLSLMPSTLGEEKEKEQQTVKSCNNLNESQRHYTDGKNLVSKVYALLSQGPLAAHTCSPSHLRG